MRRSSDIKAVIFDLGNVLVDVDSAKALSELRSHCTASGYTADLTSTQRLVCAYESGELATQAFYEAVCGHERLSVDLARFRTAYCDIFSPVDEMIAAHSAIARSGLATYIFSNTSALHFEHIRSAYAFMAAFDGYVLSYEIGCMKPGARAYEAVENVTGFRGAELLYIDDRPENIAAAAPRGWCALHHTSPGATLAALRAMDLL